MAEMTKLSRKLMSKKEAKQAQVQKALSLPPPPFFKRIVMMGEKSLPNCANFTYLFIIYYTVCFGAWKLFARTVRADLDSKFNL